MWPSEGSVSDQTLAIAAEEGFKWFGTDEGVLGRTLNVGFFRDSSGLPANAEAIVQALENSNWRTEHHRFLPGSSHLRLNWIRL